MKTIIITKVAKAVVKEARKYRVSVTADKGTSKIVLVIQKKF